jgi:cellulose 1,4-beta-cellobiosidase
LTWNTAPGAVSYSLGRALASAGPYTNLLNLTATSFADTSVANGTVYYYEVSAVNPIGQSLYSAPVMAQMPLPAISAAPASGKVILSWPLTASSFSLCSATNLLAPITWNAVTNATSHSHGEVTATLTPGGSAMFYLLINK